MSTMSSYSDLFHAKLMSSHSWKKKIIISKKGLFCWSNVGRETKCPNVGWTSPVALVASLSRFLVVAKSYGGQFRSIWEHCLLYSNGSTDGDVNKSIEICPTHMVEADHSDVLKNSYLRPRIGFKL